MPTASQRACSCLGGNVDMESRHPHPQGTVQTDTLHTAPPTRGSGRAGCPPGRGSRGPLPAAADTQTMRPAGQAGGRGESCAADVSRQREKRPGYRTDWRGAGPLPRAQGWAQKALVSVGTARSAQSPAACLGITFSLTRCWAVFKQSHNVCVRPPPAPGKAKSRRPAPLPGTQQWAGHAGSQGHWLPSQVSSSSPGH